MVRVSGGSLRGKRVETPPDERVRPTTGRMRETLFSILGSRRLDGAWVLDLFAGSGVLGIEALSRGARGAFFVESDPVVATLIRANLLGCGVENAGAVIGESVLRPGLDRIVHQVGQTRFGRFTPFDLVFLDPPYRHGLVASTLAMLADSGMLIPGAVAVAEHEAGGVGKEVSPVWRPLQNRRHGETQISFWQWKG
ncbi:MAG: 16S rRNA (guanine(966)-N(2))-methyltransferase RsmD [Magnetococcales bacterium]|nr:16S rRNA (guanine(966)-N(2))-methyltransferase RsmD [Magnetococcales bacterium]